MPLDWHPSQSLQESPHTEIESLLRLWCQPWQPETDCQVWVAGTCPVRVNAGSSGINLPHATLLSFTSCTHTGRVRVTHLLQLIRNPQPQQCFRVNTCSLRGTGMCTCDSSVIKERSLAWLFNTSRDGDSTVSLDVLFQGLATFQ